MRDLYIFTLTLLIFSNLIKCEENTVFVYKGDVLKDIDNNIYKTVKIGDQTWMAENLRTTKFKDGTAITMVVDKKLWVNSLNPAYCWYENDSTIRKNGALYNWYTIKDEKLCPKGWHIPSEAEWNTLIAFLGGEAISAGKLKEFGTVHWSTVNAISDFEFNTLLSGYRDGHNGTFFDIGYYGFLYSIQENSDDVLFRILINGSDRILTGSGYKLDGYSVRCLKD